jgi:ribonuclease HI
MKNQWVSDIGKEKRKRKIKFSFMNKYIIYTDGSSRGNPGPGGWGAIIIEERDSNHEARVKEIGGREEKTTNNRMEMTAAIEVIKELEKICPMNFSDCEVEIHTDSEYLMKGITIWIKNWMKNNWRTGDKKEVLNRDLWQELWELTQNKKIEWKKVLGHSGHELNERCDEIATGFADGKNLKLYVGPRASYQLE